LLVLLCIPAGHLLAVALDLFGGLAQFPGGLAHVGEELVEAAAVEGVHHGVPKALADACEEELTARMLLMASAAVAAALIVFATLMRISITLVNRSMKLTILQIASRPLRHLSSATTVLMAPSIAPAIQPKTGTAASIAIR